MKNVYIDYRALTSYSGDSKRIKLRLLAGKLGLYILKGEHVLAANKGEADYGSIK